MPLTGPVYPYGVRDIKVVPASGTAVDLPAARTLSFTEEPVTSELDGDDATVAVQTFIKNVPFELESGGISLAAWAALTGRTLTDDGVTPNQTQTMTISAGDKFPYVKIYGKVETDAGDLHIKFYKAKLTSIEGEFANGEFMVTSASGLAIDDGTNGIVDIVRNETSTALPTT